MSTLEVSIYYMNQETVGLLINTIQIPSNILFILISKYNITYPNKEYMSTMETKTKPI